MVERSYGSFTRSFQLPNGVDDHRIEAEFTDGLLMVHVPKAALAQPRRIEIRNSGGQPVIQGTGATPSSKTSQGSQATASRDPASSQTGARGDERATRGQSGRGEQRESGSTK